MYREPKKIIPLGTPGRGANIAFAAMILCLLLPGGIFLAMEFIKYGGIDILENLEFLIHLVIYLGLSIYLLLNVPKKQALVLYEEGLELREAGKKGHLRKLVLEIPPENISSLSLFGINEGGKVELTIGLLISTSRKSHRNITLNCPPHKREDLILIRDYALENKNLIKEEGPYQIGEIDSPHFNINYKTRSF